MVSTANFADILEISEDDFVAVCRPGLVTAALQKALAEKGLFYPPDPASVRFSTIGGNAATCAGGMRALKYGVTRDFILGIRAVLPGGEVIVTGGRTHKNVAGLDLTRLLVGSEGTLAFFTEITVKLLPRPEATATALCAHADADAALAAAGDVFRAGMLPAAMEFLDRTCLDAVAAISPLPWSGPAGAALLVRLDGSAPAVAADLERLARVLAGRSPLFVHTALDQTGQEALWAVRTMLNQASFRVAPDKLSDDVTVPRGALRRVAAGIRDIAARAGLPILVFGHVGDGNLHVNIMHHAADPGERGTALAAREEILDLALSLRGTLSGETRRGPVQAALPGPPDRPRRTWPHAPRQVRLRPPRDHESRQGLLTRPWPDRLTRPGPAPYCEDHVRHPGPCLRARPRVHPVRPLPGGLSAFRRHRPRGTFLPGQVPHPRPAGRERSVLREKPASDLAGLCLSCGRCQEACPLGLCVPDMVGELRAAHPGWANFLWKVWITRAGLAWPVAMSLNRLAGHPAPSPQAPSPGRGPPWPCWTRIRPPGPGSYPSDSMPPTQDSGWPFFAAAWPATPAPTGPGRPASTLAAWASRSSTTRDSPAAAGPWGTPACPPPARPPGAPTSSAGGTRDAPPWLSFAPPATTP